ncbi:hypothetical protein ACQPZX_42715 [Actinoplanes sp. CA-142083]|uniref:hypothetical protein n=1 Tax=Actinoplanes sp. CA-142083 TaxID=3239903 RepID=UPI003D92A7EA
MTIMAAAPIASQYRLNDAPTLRLLPDPGCPPWCVIHLGDAPVLHVGDNVAMATTGHGEHHEVHVTEELGDQAAVRLEGAGDIAMTPDEALHLAGLLILAARRAVSR